LLDVISGTKKEKEERGKVKASGGFKCVLGPLISGFS